MATIQKLEELKVWVKARQLCIEVKSLISYPPFSDDFALKNQISRSSGSVMDNIAEGFGRAGTGEFINYLMIANGSVQETKSQLYRAADRNYFVNSELERLIGLTDEISKMLIGFCAYLRNSPLRGSKYNRNK